MPAIKVGVREFGEQIARFLESDIPVAVTRRGEILGVYVPTPRKSVKSADTTELRAAAHRLTAALSDAGEEEIWRTHRHPAGSVLGGRVQHACA